MRPAKISFSQAARKFIEKKGIADVTFNLKVIEPAGCSLGIVKEIEPVYGRPQDASGYHQLSVEGKGVFISREIKVLGDMQVTLEGFWRSKRLALNGVTIPL